MAERMDKRETVSFEELLISSIYALVLLLEGVSLSRCSRERSEVDKFRSLSRTATPPRATILRNSEEMCGTDLQRT